ncbi:MAG: rhodanese-like domain-containing protein [Bacteroidales bacterium]
MKRAYIFILSVSLALITACGGAETPTKKAALDPSVAFDSLISYLENNGDFINSPDVPSMISAAEVYNLLDSNIYIIDTRRPDEFANAHIAHSVNVPFGQLLNHFETKIDPNSFSKIVLVCNAGQTASYATSLLRLVGYNNVFTLKWGISSWHRETAEEKWLARISNKYSEFLERTTNIPKQPSDFPEIITTEQAGYAILRERVKKLFSEGYKPITLSVDTLFEPNHNFYIINYWPENFYNKGHIPGAIRYQPKSSLHSSKQLNTLPINQPVVIYCFTGQHSSYVTAFLRVLGYDAYTLSFGANSFMNGFMLEEGIRSAFTEDEILDLPVTSGGSTQEIKEIEVTDDSPRGGC